MSENTTLPQRLPGSASTGVVNWNICGNWLPPCGQYTQRSTLLLTPVHVCLPLFVVIGMTPRCPCGEPCTLSIQVANDMPLGLLISSMTSDGVVNVVWL